MQEQPKTIQEMVQEAIASGRVTMRPKWHFVLKTILFGLGFVIVTCLALYLASFILFILREDGLLFVPSFGLRGWYVFLVSLPWVLVLLLALFIIVLEILVRRYSFAYRRPLIFSAIGVLVLILFGAITIENTPLHRNIMIVSEHRMPMTRNFYRYFDEQMISGVQPGKIVRLTSNGFVLECRRGDMVHVYVSQETRFPRNAIFSVGQAVVVFGERVTSTIRAFGIKLLGD